MNRKNRKRKAFTIVELLVVVLIISMLAAFVAPKVFKNIGRTKAQLSKAKMATIESAIGLFYMHCDRYPDDAEGLIVLLEPPADIEEGKWGGPYLKASELRDLWDRDYIYVAEGEINPGSYDLICLGADGMDGGEGDNADIYND